MSEPPIRLRAMDFGDSGSDHDLRIDLEVTLMAQDGVRYLIDVCNWPGSVDDAVAEAERDARVQCGDGSLAQTDWRGL